MPPILTRREFLQRVAAASAAVGIGGLAACSDDGPESDDLDRITRVAVHPSIGIARVGNSPDSFFFGPEVPGALPVAPEGFKDASGAIARQAARFRIYGYDAEGSVVRELTAVDATIRWVVSVANKKAAWYDFNTAMDIPVAKPVGRRNDKVTGTDRDRLVVAAGEREISGPGAPPVALDAGRFLDASVPLGELLTDEVGRLVYMPAEGKGYAPGQAPLTTFSDNDGWVDDTCDGPVLATVTIGSRTLTADPGWVVVTPPNYGPGIAAGLITAYDSSRLGWDTVDTSALTAEQVSFRADILPIFARLVDMQWVNAGVLGSNGWGSEAYYLGQELLDQLADPTEASAELRRRTFEQFRDPSYATEQPDAAPPMYGDGVAIPAQSAYQWLTVTPIQYAHLAAWAAGTFTDDRAAAPAPTALADLPLAEQPEALDRAGLESCLGGAYHPGIEVPWTLRVPSMWAAPLRLRLRSTVVDNPDYGDQLTPERTMAADGPVAGSGPGDLTRWQGTPWQSDAASCRSGYQPEISPVLPTFWPARIPNHVLREVDFRIVMDTTAPMADRQAAFDRRFDWERFVTSPERPDTLAHMVERWYDLGIVTEQPGPPDGAFPAVIKVETNVGFTTEPAVSTNAAGQQANPQVWDGAPVTTTPS